MAEERSFHLNLQNIPIRTPEGRRVIEAFRRPFPELMGGEYASIEMRLLVRFCAEQPFSVY